MSREFLTKQWVKNNALAAAAALALWLLMDAAYVLSGTAPYPSVWRNGFTDIVIIGFAFIGFFVATWKVLSDRHSVRAMKTLVVSLLMLAGWFIIALPISYGFYFWIGGPE